MTNSSAPRATLQEPIGAVRIVRLTTRTIIVIATSMHDSLYIKVWTKKIACSCIGCCEAHETETDQNQDRGKERQLAYFQWFATNKAVWGSHHMER